MQRVKTLKRTPTTIYLDPRLARAVKIKSAVTGKSVSDLANDALARTLREDAKDLRTIKDRKKEPVRDYEAFLKELVRDGLL